MANGLETDETKTEDGLSVSIDSEKGLTVRQAGQRGGRKTLENKGPEYFRKIGRKGGEVTASKYRDLLSAFGKKGGRPRRPSLDNYLEEGDR